jgi:hypothetical protein
MSLLGFSLTRVNTFRWCWRSDSSLAFTCRGTAQFYMIRRSMETDCATWRTNWTQLTIWLSCRFHSSTGPAFLALQKVSTGKHHLHIYKKK